MNSLAEPRPAATLGTGKLALFLVLASESVFFTTALVAYAALRGQTAWLLDHSLARLTVPLLNTGILLLSVFPAGRAVVSIRRGHRSALGLWLAAALALGLVFVAGQMFEFSHAGLRIDDQAFGGVFFTLIVFHAVHVLAGVVFLAINLIRARLGDFSARSYSSIELGTWFWYYVAAVWLVLFAALYLL
jgi:cytochrome c oxidase subunit 3